MVCTIFQQVNSGHQVVRIGYILFFRPYSVRIGEMHGRLLLPILAAFALVGCGEKPVSRTRNIADNFKDDAPTNATLTREFPSAFIDKDGKRVDLKQYRGKKSVVLVVLRGVPQGVGGAFCLGCLAQMSSLLAK